MTGRAAPPGSRLVLDFIGQSSVFIELDGVRLLTDPVTRGRVQPLRGVEPVPDRDRLRDIDAVLISHLHWDHLDPLWAAQALRLIRPTAVGDVVGWEA